MTRIEQLAQVLAANEALARELFSLNAEDAAAKLGEQGYDFTAEELKTFGDRLAALTGNAEAELDENTLDEVSGGSRLLDILKKVLRPLGGPIHPFPY